MPVRVVRGDASPEELAVLVAVLAASVGDGQYQVQPTGRDTQTSGRRPAPWGSPRRMARVKHPHGPGGWRASALPR